MIKKHILILLLIFTSDAMTQKVFPFLNNLNYLKSFHEGQSIQLDYLRPMDIKFSEELIAYIDSKSDLFVFDGREKRSEEHTSELQSRPHLVCRLLLEKKNKK